jgi:hypothetical protein
VGFEGGTGEEGEGIGDKREGEPVKRRRLESRWVGFSLCAEVGKSGE